MRIAIRHLVVVKRVTFAATHVQAILAMPAQVSLVVSSGSSSLGSVVSSRGVVRERVRRCPTFATLPIPYEDALATAWGCQLQNVVAVHP